MDRIIVALRARPTGRRYGNAGKRRHIRYKGLRAGAEVIRTVKKMGSGIVICSYKLSDMMASDLAYDLHAPPWCWPSRL
jgi:hypothetical protein